MKEIIKNKKIIICLLALGCLTIASPSLATLVDWPDSPLGTPLDSDSSLPDLVQYLYGWGVALGGLAVFIALIIAGFLYLTSVGDPAKMNEAKNRATWAIGGLILLLSSWLILHTINPELTVLRPLPEDFEEELVMGLSCKEDEDCEKWGDNYICDEDGICRVPWEGLLRKKACEKIFIATESAAPGSPGSPGHEIEIEIGDYYYYRPHLGAPLQTLLEPGEKFWWWTEPAKDCWGLLNLYEGSTLGFRCSKDFQPFLIRAPSKTYEVEEGKREMGYGQANATIFCMEFVEVPSWHVPDFAHRPRDTDEEIFSPTENCPKEPAPEACGIKFCDANNVCRWPTYTDLFVLGWCDGGAFSGDPNRYYFCLPAGTTVEPKDTKYPSYTLLYDTCYSFGCKGASLTTRCDPDTAYKMCCEGGCDPWECTAGEGCVKESGECRNPTTCPGFCAPDEASCRALGGTSCHSNSFECADCCCI